MFDEVTRQIALDLSPLLAEKELDFELDTEPVPVQAHRWMLEELARNLLHNAVKHSPPGCRLSVTVRTDAGDALLSVKDDGPGISPELRQRLFEPFSAGEVTSGSGLGLTICREIVLALGGSLALENRVKQGRVVGLDAHARLPLPP